MKCVWDVDQPKARSTDPDTSHEAAASVRNRTETQWLIFRILEEIGPAADYEIEYAYRGHDRFRPVSSSGLRTRRAELVKMGLVRDSGRREVLPSGRKAVIWELTEDAK